MTNLMDQPPQEPEAKPRFYVGVRLGILAPTVILGGEFTMPPIDHLHITHEVYDAKMSLEALIAKLKEWKKERKIRKVFCDPKQIGLIAQLRRHRFWAVDVVNDLPLAVNFVQGRLKVQKLAMAGFRGQPPEIFQALCVKVPGGISGTKECVNLPNEFLKYHVPENKPNQPTRDKPMDMDNFALSALHFLALGCAGEQIPKVTIV